MKKLGYIFISIFFAIGITTNTNLIPTMPWLIALAFMFFLLGMYCLMAKNNSTCSEKCICNDIEKHSPGGRCKANHSKSPRDGGTSFYV